MKLHLALVGIAVLLAACAHAEEDSAVIDLDALTFSKTVGQTPHILVEFFAPWCGHCKALVPEYEAAAKELKGKVPLAKVDCTTETQLCNDHGVQGFPTLKLFTTGGKVEDYDGDRTAAGIVSWLLEATGPSATEVTAADVKEVAATAASGVVILVADAADEESRETFLQAAGYLRKHYKFLISSDSEVLNVYGVKGSTKPTIFISLAGEDSVTVFSGAISYDPILDFVHKEGFPALGEISPQNYQRYVLRGLPFFWAFVDTAEITTPLGPTLQAVKAASAEHKGKISAVYLDGVKYANFKESFGFKDASGPGLVIEDKGANKKFLHPSEVSEQSVKDFLAAYFAGTLESFVKSEEIPESNDEPVKIIVGKSWEDEVVKSTKNVFVEFYAPWCGHCQHLAPIWTELAEKLAARDDLTIAKVDVTANDVPEDIQSFPVLKLYKKDDKANPVDYQGDRTLADLEKFIFLNLDGMAGDTEAEKDEL